MTSDFQIFRNGLPASLRPHRENPDVDYPDVIFPDMVSAVQSNTNRLNTD